MTVQSIGAASTTPATNLQNTGLTQDDFMNILLTQLTYQDPLKPMDNEQFVAQMAQFTNLELTRQQNDQVSTLLSMQSAAQAIGLIGKSVEVKDSTGTSQAGTVSTITFQNGSPVLSVTLADSTVLNNIALSQVYIVQ